MTQLSIICPVYNESGNLAVLQETLNGVMQRMGLSYEIIYVNDGSRDNSMQIIRQLAAADNCVKYVDFSRNFGHQIAVSAGLDKAQGEAIVIIDADMQDPPDLIEDLYKKHKEGYEVVYARRAKRKGESALKKLTAKWFYRILSRITSVEIPVDTGDFRIIDRKVLDILRQMPEQNKFLRGQIAWIGFNQTFVEYQRDARLSGDTGYSYKKMFRLAMDGITSFSDYPLKIASALGFIVSIISFIMIGYSLFAKFVLHDVVEGWTSLMLAITFIGGVQLICIGIIGEYLSRMNTNIIKRPLYIVRDTNISGKSDVQADVSRATDI